MRALFLVLFMCSLAYTQTEIIRGEPSTILNYISGSHEEFKNKTCIQYNIRKSLDNHDLLIATGFKISSIEKRVIIAETGVKYYELTLVYTDQNGNVAPDMGNKFHCQFSD